MQNTVFIVAVPLVCILGCQSFHGSQWLTPSKEHTPQILGQAPPNDPFALAALHSPPAPHSGFDPFAPIQQSALGTSQAEEEADRERIRALATTHREGTQDYMRPLNPWDGPFANRPRRGVSEHDAIWQVGYEQVAERNYSEQPLFDWDSEEPKKGFDWSILDPTKFFGKARDLAGFGPDEEKAEESMRKGREILQSNPDLADRKKNLEAAKHFIEAANRFPDSLLEEDAFHLAGECYFFADDYPNAFSMYHKLIVKHAHSKHVDNAVRRLFQVGQFWELSSEKESFGFNFSNSSLPRFGTFSYAKKAYETIFNYDPTGPVSDSALMALATAYLKRGQYQGDDNFNQAAFYYRRLREEHPLSKHIAKAYENELYARTQAYLGPEHPGRTLEEARKLAEVTLRQFGNELDSEGKAGILEIRESILTKEAERLWASGQFWDLKKQHYRAARLQYETLIIEYPQTEFAERARKRMEQIEGLPDVPAVIGFPVNPWKGDE